MCDSNEFGKPAEIAGQVGIALANAYAEWTSEGWIVPGDLDLSGLGLSKLPKIRSVDGNFDCSNNQLTSFNGAPENVGGDFWCDDIAMTRKETKC